MKNKKNKVHLYIQGNCGNQFFQYAFARSIQIETDSQLIVNYYYTEKGGNLWEGSINLLRHFNVAPYIFKKKLDFGVIVFNLIRLIRDILRLKDFYPRTYKAMVRMARWLPKLGIYYFDSAYYPFEICNRRNIYIWGFYESPKYFKHIDDRIINELTPVHEMLASNRSLYDKINSTESICITINRRNIENSKVSSFYAYDFIYYERAIDYVKSQVDNPVFFVFSDNITWCKENLKICGECYYETEGNPIWEKVRLMASCKHFIIHNSTFSWWVQHLSLNPNKIVVAPSVWMKRNDSPIDIYEDDWVYINSNNEIVNCHE